MGYMSRLRSFGNSSTPSGSSDPDLTLARATVRRRDFIFFVPWVLLSIPTLRIISTSSVSLSYFILAVLIRKCL